MQSQEEPGSKGTTATTCVQVVDGVDNNNNGDEYELSMYTVMQYEHSQSVLFNRSGLRLDTSSKANFEKMVQSKMDINDFVEYTNKPKADGTKEPDETFVFRNQILFLLPSVCTAETQSSYPICVV